MPSPMIDDLELKAVQVLRQETRPDFARQRIAGLEGTLHQRLGRGSHRVLIAGLLVPETAVADLETLQKKAASGEEVTFTADITTALEVEKMVIEHLEAEQRVGPGKQTAYRLVLAESPPLPPPAELSAFGGLGDFGLGDLGFDPGALGDVLGDLQGLAGDVMGAVDSALDAVAQLEALASLADLGNFANPVKPMLDKVGELGSLGTAFSDLAGRAGKL